MAALSIAVLSLVSRCGSDCSPPKPLDTTDIVVSHETANASPFGVDICLDPFPQNGGVSTWEALQMGVPVVARLGHGSASRIAAAVLSSIGLQDWIGDDDAAYIDIAVKFAASFRGRRRWALYEFVTTTYWSSRSA